MKLSSHDARLLHRFLDGELAAADAEVFRARLLAEPALRAAVEAEQGLRAGFAAVRVPERRAPAGFTANVLAAARRLPSAGELEAAAAGATRVLCRRLLLAASILFGIGLLWHAGLVNGGSPGTMHASPDEVQREVDRLDARLQSGAVPPPRAREGELQAERSRR
jgi:anti-sigma factor RsiW